MQEVNSTTINIIKKVLDLNKIVTMVYEEKIEDGVKQYKELQQLKQKLKDMGLHKKSLSGSNFLKMCKKYNEVL